VDKVEYHGIFLQTWKLENRSSFVAKTHRKARNRTFDFTIFLLDSIPNLLTTGALPRPGKGRTRKKRTKRWQIGWIVEQ